MTSLLTERISEFVKQASRENGIADLRQFLQDAVERARTELPPAHWQAGRFFEQLSAVQLREFAAKKDITAQNLRNEQ